MTSVIDELNFALAYYDVAWAFFHILPPKMRDEMDRLLVERQHPLAFVPGTQENRFRQLHADKFRF